MLKCNKKAVYIIGGNFANKGAEAMTLTVVKAIREQLPYLDIYMPVKEQEINEAIHYQIKPVKKDNDSHIISKITNKIQRSYSLGRSLAIIDVGGYQFGNKWAWAQRHANIIKKLVFQSVDSNKLVFFMPQAWGPFTSPELMDTIHAIINASTVSYIRDQTSMAEVVNIVGKDCSKIRFAHDIAWLFKGDDPIVGYQLIEKAGLLEKNNSITIGVTPNMRIYERSKGDGKNNEYIVFMRELLTYLCRTFNTRIILIGHELKLNTMQRQDDRYLCNILLESVDKSLPIVHIDQALKASQVKSIIGNCNMLLSSRYHALIAALSQGIPVAAIGWSHKYNELLAEAGIEENIISLSEPVKTACDKISLIMRNLNVISSDIKSKIPIFMSSAQEAVNNVVTEIKDKIGN